jgi:hypothetical protein
MRMGLVSHSSLMLIAGGTASLVMAVGSARAPPGAQADHPSRICVESSRDRGSAYGNVVGSAPGLVHGHRRVDPSAARR